MNFLITIAGYFILGCAVITIYKAIEHIVIKKPETVNYSLLLLLICTGYLQLSFGLFYIGVVKTIPLELFVTGLYFFITASYFAGPSAFLYYNSLINPSAVKVRIHLAPVLAASVFIAWHFLSRPASYLLRMRENFFYAAHENTTFYILAGAVFIIGMYTATILKIELSVKNNEKIKHAVRSLIVITSGLLLSPITLMIGFIFQWILLSAFGSLLLSINNLLFILAQDKYQDFFQSLGREIRLARYNKSILKGLDIKSLKDRLHYLMDEEKYYRSFDISMKSTADELSITPHQLSCFLNKKLHIDFRNFINRYRIKEAKQLLIDNPGQNVLAICFHVGFGSKTAFNVTFKEFTGKSPTEYRDEYVKER